MSEYPRVNDSLDESPGGFIEAVKRTVVVSLRRALTSSGLSLSDSELNVDMEYPYQRAHYPAAWVQFSFSNLEDSGLGHQETFKQAGKDRETLVRQWRYQGRVTVTFLSLSSLDRDRISDKFVSVFALSNFYQKLATPVAAPTSTFLDELDESPYVSLTVQSGTLSPGGQTASVGTPWDPSQVVYEDSYSFLLEGEFQETYTPEGGFKLKRIDVKPTHKFWETNSIPPGEYI